MTRSEKIADKKDIEIRFINYLLKRMTLKELNYVYRFSVLGYAKKKIKKEKDNKADRKLVKQGKLEWRKIRSPYIEF